MLPCLEAIRVRACSGFLSAAQSLRGGSGLHARLAQMLRGLHAFRDQVQFLPFLEL